PAAAVHADPDQHVARAHQAADLLAENVREAFVIGKRADQRRIIAQGNGAQPGAILADGDFGQIAGEVRRGGRRSSISHEKYGAPITPGGEKGFDHAIDVLPGNRIDDLPHLRKVTLDERAVQHGISASALRRASWSRYCSPLNRSIKILLPSKSTRKRISRSPSACMARRRSFLPSSA